MTKRMIFIVDDETFNRDIAARHLKKMGYDSRQFPDGASVLQALTSETPDLILLDIHMPGMSGLEVLTAARQTTSKSELPILMVTADSNPDSVVKAFEIGANDYVTKPIDSKTLGARIDTHLHLSAATKQIRAFAEGAEKIVAEQAVDLQKRNDDLVREIKLRMKVEAELREAKRRAEDENRGKSEFLALMTHELITPLHVSLGFAELISGDEDGTMGPERYREYAGHVAVSARQLLCIVKDMLALVKHDIGKLALNESEVSISELLCRALSEARPSPNEAGVTIDMDCSPDLELLGDRFLLTRAFSGLLSNAVKFSSKEARCSIAATALPDRSVEIKISDEGIGFNVHQLSELSSPFRQSSKGLTRTHQGLGIGIPLARAVFQLHGASISIDSAVGKGTTVSVLFPSHRALLAPVSTSQRAAG
ncbi:MAG: response regulator [Parvularculaceae bacterium]|nr:response regulator [Parvularculaceae bacterium]